jgi:predicted ArsR family transcriptional regulator
MTVSSIFLTPSPHPEKKFTTIFSVENDRGSGRTLGPRGRGSAPPLSAARRDVLEHLRGQPEPLSLASLVVATGLHENTLRGHLTALVQGGLVRRHRSEPAGRGRPAWLYELTEQAPTDSEYAGLAAALAATIARTSPDPAGAAAVAGEEWGRELARDRGASPTPPETARERVVRLLDDLGFAPGTERARPEEVRLTRCPLLEAARRHPDVVCAVHLGIVRGALAEHGADPDGSELAPFAEPGACLLRIPPYDTA